MISGNCFGGILSQIPGSSTPNHLWQLVEDNAVVLPIGFVRLSYQADSGQLGLIRRERFDE